MSAAGTAAAPDLAQLTTRALGADGPLARKLAHFTARPEQQALAQSIAQALATRSVLVAEAGTGTGKTFAYLVPLLLSGARVVVSTGTRHLQDQLYARDLPMLQQALGRGVQTALLKGRSNYVCRYRLARHLHDGRFADSTIPNALRQIQRFAAISASGDRAECVELDEEHPAWAWATSTRENCLGQECPDSKECFVYRARREAQQADCVVVNHHLFCADLALREDTLAELLPNADALVFDEAHQLPAVLTEFSGEGVTTRQCHDLARDLLAVATAVAPDGAVWWQLAGKLDEAAHDLLGVLGPELEWGGEARKPRGAAQRWSAAQLAALPELEDVIDALLAALAAVAGAVAANAGRAPELDQCGARATALLECAQRWIQALAPVTLAPPDAPAHGAEGPEAAESSPELAGAVIWAECQGMHAGLRRTPLAAGASLSRFRAAAPRAWVFVSATLTVAGDFRHFVTALDLAEARCERWGSPFDYARQAALWVPRGLSAPQSPEFSVQVLDAVWPLLRANRGRAFVLSTTLRAMRTMAARLAELNAADGAGLTRLVQGEAPRHRLLERFRTEPAAVLIGSAGFWEGVDVAGDALSLVVIDKLPFAPPDDPVLQARCDALRRAGRDPFTEEQLPAAALALQQGVGRLIRSERDRGVLVVCDERLLTRGYGRRLLASLPPFTRVESWQAATRFLPEH